MNSSLASFIFSGETLFRLPEEGLSLENKISKETIVPTKKLLSKKTAILSTPFSDSEKELLEKIMGSVNTPLAQTEIITTNQFDNYDFTNLNVCKEIISFGFFKELEVSKNVAPKYQVLENSNFKILVADPLSIISENQGNEKRLLWTSLKSLFGI